MLKPRLHFQPAGSIFAGWAIPLPVSTDNEIGYPQFDGWFVDDIRIYTCNAAPPTQHKPDREADRHAHWCRQQHRRGRTALRAAVVGLVVA